MLCEYIWLDGYSPEPNLRSKTKVIHINGLYNSPDSILNLENYPEWNFDGSSTLQAEGNNSDCTLKPVRAYINPLSEGILVLCEVYDENDSPHKSNTRNLIENDINIKIDEEKESYYYESDYWFGFEQEYVIKDLNTNKPLGFPKKGFPEPQGRYYCGLNVTGRELAEEHLKKCLNAGLNITGLNQEVMLGQWEFQLLGQGAKKAADDLWIARFILMRLAEKYQVEIDFSPKPVEGDWNGSGLHTNFSNYLMRNEENQNYFQEIITAFSNKHKEHIEVYGSDNDKRLTGKHETAHIKEFKYGVSDRGASIRIPRSTAKSWIGYLEDRRPAANADPYKIVKRIIDTIEEI